LTFQLPVALIMGFGDWGAPATGSIAVAKAREVTTDLSIDEPPKKCRRAKRGRAV
jgi:hypothetical protein